MSPGGERGPGAYPQAGIAGLILAGGEGRRMGGADKALALLHGKPLLAHVQERLASQVARGWVSVRRGARSYPLAWPVVPDSRPLPEGPLAGVAAGLSMARRSGVRLLLVVPCDAPCLPMDLGQRLYRVMQAAGAVAAAALVGGRVQPTFALLHTELADRAELALARGQRGLGRWVLAAEPALADFSDVPSAFVNINTPEQLQALQTAPEGDMP